MQALSGLSLTSPHCEYGDLRCFDKVSEDRTVALVAESIEAQFELLDDSAQYHSKLVGDDCKTLQQGKLRSNEIL